MRNLRIEGAEHTGGATAPVMARYVNSEGGADVFLRRQDLIDRFDANFHSEADGQIIFQPPRSKYGAPVSVEEYDAAMIAFERRQMIAMAATWLAFGTAGAYGLYRVMAFDDYGSFFVAFGLATAASFALSSRAYIAPLQPFMKRRDALRAALKKQEKTT